jgi:ribosomal protein S14
MRNEPEFTLHPQPRDAHGSRVRFECHECGHSETFIRLQYADMAHVLGSDHYWGECPEVRWQGVEEPWHVAHRAELAGRHRAT